MSVGKLTEFDVQGGNWTLYIQRVDMYFKANGIKDELKVPILISVVGEAAYEIMVNLCTPKNPCDKSYTELVSVMEAFLQPKPSMLSERYRFRQCKQAGGQSIAHYVTQLKKMARYCDFGNTLNENLRDQLICGILSDTIRQKLFSKEKITFEKALSLALSLEGAERDAQLDATSSTVTNVFKLTSSNCTGCGDIHHSYKDCRFRDYICGRCNQKGHLRRVCSSTLANDNSFGQQYSNHGNWSNTRSQRGGWGFRGNNFSFGGANLGRSLAGRGRARGHVRGSSMRGVSSGGGAGWVRSSGGAGTAGPVTPTHWVRGESEEGNEEYVLEGTNAAENEEPVYQMTVGQYRPVSILVKINSQEIIMEVDTGSAISCISERMYKEKFYMIPLQTCDLVLRFYDGTKIRPLGLIEVTVEYNEKKKVLDLYVINSGSTSLIGRQWLAEMSIKIPTLGIHKISDLESGFDKQTFIKQLISRHNELFKKELGCYTGESASLRLRAGAVPVFCRARPLPYALRERVDAELDAMLRAGVIEPVDHSDWATPLVIVHKPDGSLRLCADYKVTLNRVLLVDKYPVPKVDDLLSRLGGSVYFTKLDLSQAYNQVCLSPDSTDITVINTHRGLFKYKRLVFGLSSSPGIFQRIMSNLFKDIPNVVVFLDDICIFSKTISDHLETLEQVLNKLGSHGLRIKKEKCEFFSKEIKYLGFVIGSQGIRVDLDKVKPIIDMTAPTNTTELKSFLGMINFYGKFIKNLSTCLSPLYELLRKNQHWYWSNRHQRAFLEVKQLLRGAEVLAHYDIGLPVIVTCDASSRGLGAVLAQRGDDGRERVVAYASRALTPAEVNYSQIHKEALAIIFTVQKFHQFLYGRKFLIRTDHKPLVSIFGPNFGIPSMTASRLQRWALILSAYDFDIEYVTSNANTADALSRLISAYKADIVKEDEVLEQTYLHFATDGLLLDYNLVRKETGKDPLCSRVLRFIREGWPEDVEINELKPFFNRKKELYIELDCIMWGHRVVIPHSLQSRVLRELHDTHMGIVKTKSLARSYVWWPGVDEAVERLCAACEVCAVVASAPASHQSRLWPWPSRPWARVHIDFLGPLAGAKYLVLVDACSKWIEIVKMNMTTAKHVIKILYDFFSRYGIPRQLVSDNGPPFSSEEMNIFCQSNGIEQLFSAPYHPASNGAAENAVKLCKRVIKKALLENFDPELALQKFLLLYRNTVHSTTSESPAQIFLGRSIRTKLDCLKPDREKQVSMFQRRNVKYSKGVTRQFLVGDRVWFRQFGSHDKWEKGRIVDRLGNTDYKLETCDGSIKHRHIDQLRARYVNTFSNTGLPVTSENSDAARNAIHIGPLPGEVEESEDSLIVDGAEAPGSRGVVAGSLPGLGIESSSGFSGVAVSPVGERPKSSRIRKPPVRYGIDEFV